MPVILLSSGGWRRSTPRAGRSAFSAAFPSPGNRPPCKRELLRVLGPESSLAVVPIEPQRVLEQGAAEDFPAKILVVDDNPTNRHVVITVLKALGYSPTSP